MSSGFPASPEPSNLNPNPQASSQSPTYTWALNPKPSEVLRSAPESGAEAAWNATLVPGRLDRSKQRLNVNNTGFRL